MLLVAELHRDMPLVVEVGRVVEVGGRSAGSLELDIAAGQPFD